MQNQLAGVLLDDIPKLCAYYELRHKELPSADFNGFLRARFDYLNTSPSGVISFSPLWPAPTCHHLAWSAAVMEDVMQKVYL